MNYEWIMIKLQPMLEMVMFINVTVYDIGIEVQVIYIWSLNRKIICKVDMGTSLDFCFTFHD
jgi:hypothetical protein